MSIITSSSLIGCAGPVPALCEFKLMLSDFPSIVKPMLRTSSPRSHFPSSSTKFHISAFLQRLCIDPATTYALTRKISTKPKSILPQSFNDAIQRTVVVGPLTAHTHAHSPNGRSLCPVVIPHD